MFDGRQGEPEWSEGCSSAPPRAAADLEPYTEHPKTQEAVATHSATDDNCFRGARPSSRASIYRCCSDMARWKARGRAQTDKGVGGNALYFGHICPTLEYSGVHTKMYRLMYPTDLS